MTYYSFDTIRGNQVLTNNFINCLENYTKEEQETLINGGMVPFIWDDETGEIEEWFALHEED